MASTQKRGRGRPAVFVGKKADRIAALIEKFGATGAREKLASYAKPVSVSMPTLLGIAAKYGIELHRGRRAA